MYLPNNIEERLKKQMDFIVEIDKAKSIYRRNLLADGSRNENDAEHMWHLSVMAMILSEYADENVDISKVIRMALVHDLVEIYAGDTFAYDVGGYTDKEDREALAADKLYSILPEEQGKELKALWEEFDALETLESKYANAIDRISPMLENHLTDDHTWKLGNVTRTQILKRLEPVRIATPKLYDIGLFFLEEAIKKEHVINK